MHRKKWVPVLGFLLIVVLSFSTWWETTPCPSGYSDYHLFQINSTTTEITNGIGKIIWDSNADISLGYVNPALDGIYFMNSSGDFMPHELEGNTNNTVNTVIWLGVSTFEDLTVNQTIKMCMSPTETNPQNLSFWTNANAVRVFHFGENSYSGVALDSSGNANGTYTGSGTISKPVGAIGQAVSFTKGIGNYVNTANPNLFSAGTSTTTIWLYDNSSLAHDGISGVWTTHDATQQGGIFFIQDFGGYKYRLYHAPGTTLDDGLQTTYDDAWQHWGLVQNSTTTSTILVNGSSVVSGATGTAVDGSATLYLGQGYPAQSRTWQGFIEEFRIYSDRKSEEWLQMEYGTFSTDLGVYSETPTNDSINITLLSPADSYLTLNHTINYTYQATTTQNATCNLYIDSINEYNDSALTGVTTITNIHNLTHGSHSWYVYCEQNNDSNINRTSATRNLEVYFNITQNNPDNGISLSGNSTFFNYTTDNLYPITCNLTLDTVVIDSVNISSAQDTTHTESGVSTGAHTWYVICSAEDKPIYTQTTASRTFTMNVDAFNYTLNLSTAPENVISSPQMLFYDINGDLNALYFIDEAPNDRVVIKRIVNNTVTATFTTALNATKQYFVVFREDGYTGILTFSQDGTKQHYLNLTASSLSVITEASPYNPTDNDNFDAYTVAYTKQYDTLSYTADSFFLFFMPNASTTNLVKKYAGNTTLYTVDTANDDPTLSWGTIANESDLSEWYYIFPKDNGIYNRLALYSYNGTNSTEVQELSVDVYTVANLEALTVYFEEYDSYTYAFASNATDAISDKEDRIYLIEENVTYELNENIPNPSHFLFVTKDTFVFFYQAPADTYAYSCYYNTTALSCTKFPSLEYGTTVPYDRGAFTTTKRDSDNADEITRGSLSSDTVTQLHYNRNTYDTKFIMIDEQNEERRMFTLNLFSDTNAMILTNQSWGWVIPSVQIGNGTQKAYTLGEDGVVRLFVTGLSYGYNLELYTLNITQGNYYTFTVENIFGVPIESARISAYRYMPSKASWAIIEQGITDSNGNAVLFLEPLNLYRLVIENSGYVTLNLDYIPTGTTDVTIKLDQEGAGSIILPDFDYVFQDVSFSVLPQDITIRNITNLTFHVTSNASKLEYYGMRVVHVVNSTATEVCLNNITTQPSGGIILCEANLSGQYLVYYYFKHEDHEEYTPNFRAYTYTNQTTGFIFAKDYFGANSPISGWSIYFAGVVLAMLTVGFASRYTIDGAGLAGLAVLWIFTFFVPDAVIAGGLTATVVTIVTTIATVAGLYIRSYVS